MTVSGGSNDMHYKPGKVGHVIHFALRLKIMTPFVNMYTNPVLMQKTVVN